MVRMKWDEAIQAQKLVQVGNRDVRRMVSDWQMWYQPNMCENPSTADFFGTTQKKQSTSTQNSGICVRKRSNFQLLIFYWKASESIKHFNIARAIVALQFNFITHWLQFISVNYTPPIKYSFERRPEVRREKKLNIF